MIYRLFRARINKRVVSVFVLTAIFAGLGPAGIGGGGKARGISAAYADEAAGPQVDATQRPGLGEKSRRCEILAKGGGTVLRCRGGPPETVGSKVDGPAQIPDAEGAAALDGGIGDDSGASPDAPNASGQTADNRPEIGGTDPTEDKGAETSPSDNGDESESERSTEPAGPVLTKEEELQLILRGWE